MLTPLRFGLELAPEVVQADGNVRNLAWRICNAKRVLVRTSLALVIIGVNTNCRSLSRPPTACRGTVPQPQPRTRSKSNPPDVICRIFMTTTLDTL